MKNSTLIDAPASTSPEIYLPGFLVKQAPSQKSFFTYLYVENKIYNLLMLILIIAQFIVFKLLYPFPTSFPTVIVISKRPGVIWMSISGLSGIASSYYSSIGSRIPLLP